MSSKERWQTHGWFSGSGRGYTELPHFEIEDRRRPIYLEGATCVHDVITQELKSVEHDRIKTASQLRRHLVQPQEFWSRALHQFTPRKTCSEITTRENYLHIRALAKATE
ncbi:MAG: hypothetical protein A49_11800 [Methyloceanibacter sp.]|nr:MAG: hypothetical protein A49_11800 [Methyloceanibacter sp.]